jgi:hypothetical protein
MQKSTPGAKFGPVGSDIRAKRCVNAGHLRVKFDPRKRTYFGVHAGDDPRFGRFSECTRVMTRVEEKPAGRGSTRVGHTPGQNPKLKWTGQPEKIVFLAGALDSVV